MPETAAAAYMRVVAGLTPRIEETQQATKALTDVNESIVRARQAWMGLPPIKTDPAGPETPSGALSESMTDPDGTRREMRYMRERSAREAAAKKHLDQFELEVRESSNVFLKIAGEPTKEPRKDPITPAPTGPLSGNPAAARPPPRSPSATARWSPGARPCRLRLRARTLPSPQRTTRPARRNRTARSSATTPPAP